MGYQMKALSITSRTITIELENDDIYYTNEFEIILNDKFVRKENRNVFTIFDLLPNTNYVLNINNKL